MDIISDRIKTSINTGIGMVWTGNIFPWH